MKAVVAAVIALIIVAGGAYAITKHNNNKSGSSTYGSNSSSSSSSKSSKSSTGSSNSSTAAATSSVTINNFAFSPASITVKKGTTVTWTNKDSVGHTVTENDGQSGPNSDTLDNGKSYSFTYNTAGTFKYHCSIHTDMAGTIIVTE